MWYVEELVNPPYEGESCSPDGTITGNFMRSYCQGEYLLLLSFAQRNVSIRVAMSIPGSRDPEMICMREGRTRDPGIGNATLLETSIRSPSD